MKKIFKLGRFLPAYSATVTSLLFYALILNSGHLGSQGKFFWDVSEFITFYGTSDAGSYLRLASDISNLRVSQDNIWILNLWPPGMSILDSLAIALPGSLFFWMIVMNVLIMALPIAVLLSMVRSRVDLWWAIGISLVFVFQPNKSWVLTEGLFMSDGVGSHFFLTGLILCIKGLVEHRDVNQRDKTQKYFILAGVTFSLSLHFRFGLFPSVGVLVFLALIGIALSFTRRSLKTRFLDLKKPMVSFLMSLFLVSAPWTLFVATILHPGNLSWSTGDYQWAQRWMTDNYLLEGNAGWLVTGGANWACEVSPQRCEALQGLVTSGDGSHFGTLRQSAIETAILNPIDLFILKTGPLSEATWLTSGAQLTGAASLVQLAGFGLILGFLVISFFVFTRIHHPAWIAVVVVFGYLATLVIAHVESRYMIVFWDVIILAILPVWFQLFRTRGVFLGLRSQKPNKRHSQFI
jgi:hypothetical protein